MKNILLLLIVVAIFAKADAQTAQAFEQENKKATGSLLDPSCLTVHHSISMGMSTSGGSDIKSQSLYSTMLQYQVSKPVTLQLNFGLPIYSSFSKFANFDKENLVTGNYLRSMPIEAAVIWQPQENMLFRFSVVNRQNSSPYDFLTRSSFFDPMLIGEGLKR